jgi:hypothetical protein
LAVDRDDLRDLPLSMRKTNLDRLLRGRPDGMVGRHGASLMAIDHALLRASSFNGLQNPTFVGMDLPEQGGLDRVASIRD